MDDCDPNDNGLLQTTLSVHENLAFAPYPKVVMELNTVSMRAQQALYVALRERNPELPIVENQPPFSWPVSVVRLLKSLKGLGYEITEDRPKDPATWHMKAEREGDWECLVVESCGPVAALAQITLLAHQQSKPRISLQS